MSGACSVHGSASTSGAKSTAVKNHDPTTNYRSGYRVTTQGPSTSDLARQPLTPTAMQRCANCGQVPPYTPIRVHGKVFCSLAHLDQFLKTSPSLKPCNNAQCTTKHVTRDRQLYPLDGFTAEL